MARPHTARAGAGPGLRLGPQRAVPGGQRLRPWTRWIYPTRRWTWDAGAPARPACSVNWIERDLDQPLAGWPEGTLAPADGYALLLVVRFVDLPLIRELIGKLAPGGMLVTEQHIVTAAAVGGPTDPAFRLQPGALRGVAEGLRVLFYEEGIVDDPGQQPMALARLVAQKTAATG
jgi:hypothetical protein